MCEVLGVSKSGYYHWRQFLKDSIKTATLDKEIKGIFEQSNQTYGSPRVCKALQKKGVEVSERKVARRMQALKISPKVKKKFKGIKICRQARANWVEEFDKRTNPQGRIYYWLTGKFVNMDKGEDTDEWALANNYISIVPVQFDLTAHHFIHKLNNWNL